MTSIRFMIVLNTVQFNLGFTIGKVSDLRSTAPQESFLVWPICNKVAFDQISRLVLVVSLLSGDFAFASPYALYAKLFH